MERSWEYINRSQTHECENCDWFLSWEYINGIFVVVCKFTHYKYKRNIIYSSCTFSKIKRKFEVVWNVCPFFSRLLRRKVAMLQVDFCFIRFALYKYEEKLAGGLPDVPLLFSLEFPERHPVPHCRPGLISADSSFRWRVWLLPLPGRLPGGGASASVQEQYPYKTRPNQLLRVGSKYKLVIFSPFDGTYFN